MRIKKTLGFLFGVFPSALTCPAQNFYETFPTALILDYDIAAVEIDNGYLVGDNEVNAAVNFHSAIRLTRTDYAGNIAWSGLYDAGPGTSVHLFRLLRTSDDHVLALGYAGPDNNAVASESFLLKLDSTGTPLWSKQYGSFQAYRPGYIAEIPNAEFVFSMQAFPAGEPVLCRVDNNGNVLSAARYDVPNAIINGILVHGNTLDLVVNSQYVLNTDLTGIVIHWQRQYDNSLQFNSLVSNRCSNGNLVYMAGQNAGGFGFGTSRLFRTDSAGTLLWSKNIAAWSGPAPAFGNTFDVVTHVDVRELANGDIVGASVDEGGTLLFTVFDAAGNYLYNRNRVAIGQQHSVAVTTSGNYLVGSVFGFQPFSTVSSYPLSSGNVCDSILSVSITNGVDSMAASPRVVPAPETVSAITLPLNVIATVITPVVYCSLLSGTSETEPATPEITLFPNPATGKLMIDNHGARILAAEICDLSGIIVPGLLDKDSGRQPFIDVSRLHTGMYFLKLKTQAKTHTFRFLKE